MNLLGSFQTSWERIVLVRFRFSSERANQIHWSQIGVVQGQLCNGVLVHITRGLPVPDEV